ncbi:hypothetical protein KSF78_0003165 [Schistosoma japonicum]|nr:hypothetical protein KSF78_0003165 [Schistosoma japonicum]
MNLIFFCNTNRIIIYLAQFATDNLFLEYYLSIIFNRWSIYTFHEDLSALQGCQEKGKTTTRKNKSYERKVCMGKFEFAENDE